MSEKIISMNLKIALLRNGEKDTDQFCAYYIRRNIVCNVPGGPCYCARHGFHQAYIKATYGYYINE